MYYYYKVFIEAMWTASIIPFSTDATLISLKLFGGYNMQLAVVLAIIGSCLGQIFNLMAGSFVLSFYKRGVLHVSDKWYRKISTFFNKYGVFLLLFSWVSICKILVVIAGFLDAPLKFTLPLIIIGEIYHYSSFLF